VFEGYLVVSYGKTNNNLECLANTLDSASHITHPSHPISPNSVSLKPFLQTQDLMAENDFLKRQIGSLKGQIEDKVSEARHMMERNQDNDTEMKRMRELVRSQEE